LPNPIAVESHRVARLRRLAILAVLVFAVPASPLRADPARDLKSKDVSVRIAAVHALRASDAKDVEKLLLKALDDRDWEVQEEAANALADRGGEAAVKALVKTAILGPVRRVRQAAADALGVLDADAAGFDLARRAGGPTALVAIEALTRLAPHLKTSRKDAARAIRRGLAIDEIEVQRAAARALAVFPRGERRVVLKKLLDHAMPSVRCAALDAARRWPSKGDLSALVDLQSRPDQPDVVERRIVAALRALVDDAADEKEAADLGRKVLFGFEIAKDPSVARRFVRLAALLGTPRRAEGEEAADRAVPLDVLKPVIEGGMRHAAPAVRAAAVHAALRVAHDAWIDLALELAKSDPDARVRGHALRTVVDARGVLDDKIFALVADRLRTDDDAGVREEAAVRLGEPSLGGAVPTLVASLGDASWEVAVCAAVSLGKTGDYKAIAPLRELRRHRDWKMRAAAVVGFGRLRRKEVVPDLIDALGSKDTPSAASAYEFLRRLTTKVMEPQSKLWRDWWEENERKYEFRNLEAEARESKKHGYAVQPVKVYEDLDVIVLQSRGDHIEGLLDKLGVGYRLTRGGQVPDAGVHPLAMFVSNCTGEVTTKDVEQLAWFVRTGGALFCSCWALKHTAELVYPGVVQKLGTRGQVLDNVVAEACPTDSVFLDDVFDGITRPIYVLYGAHLIEVLDPERAEVLIDSPDCADLWTDGNLACWFKAGHGVILDSANHFDLQGLEKAESVKGADGRRAYAMDHMGLDYAELRRLDAKRVWGSRSKSANAARDLSAFRLITNFVRAKRRADSR